MKRIAALFALSPTASFAGMCYEGNLVTPRAFLDCHNENVIAIVLLAAVLVVAWHAYRKGL